MSVETVSASVQLLDGVNADIGASLRRDRKVPFQFRNGEFSTLEPKTIWITESKYDFYLDHFLVSCTFGPLRNLINK